jgi:hypothetical protein
MGRRIERATALAKLSLSAASGIADRVVVRT